MNTAGWMLTENGRQPWIVQGLMLTSGRRLAVGQHDEVVISLVVFVLLYAALGVVDWRPDAPLRPQASWPRPTADEPASADRPATDLLRSRR